MEGDALAGTAATEARLLGVAVILYLSATASAVYSTGFASGRQRVALLLLASAIAVHSISIVLRWDRLGHAPYVDLFEILSSNVWSLHLGAALVFFVMRPIRPALAIVLPILSVLTVWMWSAPVKDTISPVTYDTIWLPIHATLGKFFLGLATPAAALGVALLVRWRLNAPFSSLPSSAAVEIDIYRLLLVAGVFQTLMLIAGAAWAQDAWSRYWAWDPLESWAFVSWTATLLYLHMRPRAPVRWKTGALFSVLIFVLAFYTFFGVPFLSTAPHKGAI